MMKAIGSLGLVYHCEICGAELTILATGHGAFVPRCCNSEMIPLPRRVAFYICDVCGARIALVRSGKRGAETFHPRCCNTDMYPKAA